MEMHPSKSRSKTLTDKTTEEMESGFVDEEEEEVSLGGTSGQFSNGSGHLDNSFSGLDSSSEERDEIAEVEKLARKETNRIRLWRFVLAFVLVGTAVIVTATTFHYLRVAQTESFTVAFNKFSRTVGDAALQSQQILHDTQRDVCDNLAVDAVRTNQTWPYYTNAYYEMYFGSALEQANAELSAFFPVVAKEDRDNWIDYAGEHLKEWTHAGHMTKYGSLDRLNEIGYVSNITKPNPTGYMPKFIPDDEWYEYWPMWLYSPPPAQYGAVNWNLITVPDYEGIIQAGKALKGEAVITKVRRSVSTGTAYTEEEHLAMHSKLKTGSSPDHPHSFIWTPVYEDPQDINSKFVAVLATNFAWDFSLRNLLPDNVQGMIVIITNDCNQTYTYEISGKDAYYMGEGDRHERKYDDFKVEVNLSLLKNPLKDVTRGHCQYKMHIYPSSFFEAAYDQNTPEIFAGIVAITFGVIAVVIIVYDVLIQRRNSKLVANAARSNAVVTSLFPGSMRDRILEQQIVGTKNKMKHLMSDGNNALMACESMNGNDKPLADLFLDTTVLFADITGFTAWSSVREPSQVFTLLENVYATFDALAKQRRIFKVEVVGDCWVGCTGIPEPRKDQVVSMVRFARDCIASMKVLTRKLERTLGPGTAELGIRVGMHSGPVTAGVLRGDKARFQLFGDTMNTTARIENSGASGKIHVSKETAELLRCAGKGQWLVPRKEGVNAKGKGHIETFWVNTKSKVKIMTDDSKLDNSCHSSVGFADEFGEEDEEQKRLVEWNCEMLLQLLKQVVASRSKTQYAVASSAFSGNTKLQAGDLAAIRSAVASRPSCNNMEYAHLWSAQHAGLTNSGKTPLEEVKEIITLPEFDASNKSVPVGEVQIPAEVVAQLHDLVSEIVDMYNNNPFHNFAHASHVVMSVIKLMSRIVAPDKAHLESAAMLHDHTYGITSDPLTQFACAFSALIHDADHVGVSNAQLVKEKVPIASKYGERSVAEQNSLDLSWELLMSPRFATFRAFLFPTEAELIRFRQLVVNAVMSTDIVDKDLKALRNARWDKAFKKGDDSQSSLVPNESSRDQTNRKATIVIEHIIQASDISHTMQHWHVYRKWNQNLFEELYVAYLNGRMDKDPSDFWYKGEFGFFDFYIIPLTQKLKDCGVFGVSSGEYLDYAKKNRAEWEARGEEVVAGMIRECHEKYGVKGSAKLQQGNLLPCSRRGSQH